MTGGQGNQLTVQSVCPLPVPPLAHCMVWWPMFVFFYAMFALTVETLEGSSQSARSYPRPTPPTVFNICDTREETCSRVQFFRKGEQGGSIQWFTCMLCWFEDHSHLRNELRTENNRRTKRGSSRFSKPVVRGPLPARKFWVAASL
jgi:hypothetical protein